MKNKLLIILLILFIPFVVNATSKKGDLRCPTSNLDGAVCTETKDQNGTVISTKITKRNNHDNGSYAEVSKIVSKVPNELGRYKVEFEVSGKKVSSNLNSDGVYVIIGFDTSTTMEDKKQFNAAKNAIKAFAHTLCPDNTKCEYNIMLVQFAKYCAIVHSFDDNNKNLDNFNSFYQPGKGSDIGTTSELGKFYELAYNQLLDKTDALKYVVVFGDGKYYYGVGCPVRKTTSNDTLNHTNCYKIETYRSKLIDEQNVKIYGIRFKEKYEDNNYIKGNVKDEKENKCIGLTNKDCNQIYMKKYVSDSYYSANNIADFTNAFQETANDINESVENESSTIPLTLTDKLGYNFTILNQDNATKIFEINKINETIYKTEPFYIEINDEAESRAWHATNDSFTLNYQINGENYELSSNLNPEVYWVLNENKIDSCSGTAYSDNIFSTNETYYSKYCQEGYLDNYEYKNGLSMTVKVNNVVEGTKKFTLQMGMGFPIEVNLETNIKCTYKIDYDEMQKEIKNLNNSISKTTDAKEKASLTKKLNNLKNNNYQELVKNDLEDYASRFTNQTARLKIYYSSNETDGILLENKGDVKYQVNCNTPTTTDSVITNLTCYAYLAKDMQLPSACLEMKDGEQAECNNNNTQIDGGNNFYVKMKEKSGRIYVELHDAGYDMGTNVETSECSYSEKSKYDKDDNTDGNNNYTGLTFRQIELADPFLTEYDSQREIGGNYKNSQYNFSKIIKSDVWNEKPYYRFSLSKSDVYQIKNSSSESNSYLGTDCHINADKKYVCDFLDENSSYFSKVEIN